MIFEFDYEINDMSEEVKSATKEQLQRALVHIGMKMHEMAVKLAPLHQEHDRKVSRRLQTAHQRGA